MWNVFIRIFQLPCPYWLTWEILLATCHSGIQRHSQLQYCCDNDGSTSVCGWDTPSWAHWTRSSKLLQMKKISSSQCPYRIQLYVFFECQCWLTPCEIQAFRTKIPSFLHLLHLLCCNQILVYIYFSAMFSKRWNYHCLTTPRQFHHLLQHDTWYIHLQRQCIALIALMVFMNLFSLFYYILFITFIAFTQVNMSTSPGYNLDVAGTVHCTGNMLVGNFCGEIYIAKFCWRGYMGKHWAKTRISWIKCRCRGIDHIHTYGYIEIFVNRSEILVKRSAL